MPSRSPKPRAVAAAPATADTERPLALLGATPAFAEPLHVGRPNIGDRARLLARIEDMLDRRWFSNNGPLVQEFEAALGRLLGVKHCIATCNGTVALMLAIRALGMTGEVIVPSFTFVATAHALQWQEVTPVFADIDPETHNLDPASVERLITPRTTGIIGVHLWGRACAIGPLQELARKRNLRLLFDSSHALACTWHGQMLGQFGDAEVFSFHATKFVSAFEGGAVVTNDDALATKLRLMRNFGFTGYDRVEDIGTNGKMTEVCAAMGLTGLESLDEFVACNQRNYAAYQKALSDLRGLKLLEFDPHERHNLQYVVLELDETDCPLTRDELLNVLHAEGVLARQYFYPGCHGMEPYRSLFPDWAEHLPVTERLSERVLVLPTGGAVDQGDIETIGHIIRAAFAQADGVRKLLQKS